MSRCKNCDVNAPNACQCGDVACECLEFIENNAESVTRHFPRLEPVFILCVTISNGERIPVATAFAVDCLSRRLLMTVAQAVTNVVEGSNPCEWVVAGSPFFICDGVDAVDGVYRFENLQQVEVVAYYGRSNIAVLRALIPFPSDVSCFRVCPVAELASARNEDRVKLYKCEVQLFSEAPSQMPVLSPSVTECVKVTGVSDSHIWFPRPQSCGSSGGPLVDLKGRLVGINIDRWRANLTPNVNETHFDDPDLQQLCETGGSVELSTYGFALAVIPQKAIPGLIEVLKYK